jgi:ligand-binding sensor domain-containing protein
VSGCERYAPGGGCEREGFVGGGVGRWDGRSWARWSKAEGAALAANGPAGDFGTLVFDRSRATVWAGTWVGDPAGFHWLRGLGTDASVSWCPRACAAPDWQSVVFEDEGAVRALALDADGRLWAGTSRDRRGLAAPLGGVKVLAGGRWAVHSAADGGLPAGEVTALAAEGDGVWAGTLDAGAARWRPVELTPRLYLPSASRPAAGGAVSGG